MKITAKDQSQTEKCAAILANICQSGDVIALSGDLGMGKSVFARSFIQTLCGANTDVPSPTFTIVQSYDFEEGEINHYDFYRLENPDDCLELGIEEAFYDTLCLVEWPQKIGGYLPWDCLHIEISPHGSDEMMRTIEFSSQGNWMDRLDFKEFE